MTEKFFLEVVLVLIACLVGLLAFIWNAHLKQHAEINAILKELTKTKSSCLAIFARKEEVAEINGRLSTMEK